MEIIENKDLCTACGGKCYTFVDGFSIVQPWEQYQKLLARLVKRITGMSVDQRFRLDVENLFIDVMRKNFENVSKIELEEIVKLLPLLIKTYPQEYLNAKEKCELNTIVKVKKNSLN